ncbi:tetratricopeptide repeat protein [Shivajiella indica]|uniref:Tetratricopeptide repeat protein n=1 Tax=Shivajiella indica TaxID=872115 RepID=A0ABW5B562_9BACT
MKKGLILLLLLSISNLAYNQSGLYQTNDIKKLDDNFELFSKHLFSASKYEFASLKERDLDTEPEVQTDFLYAVSSLKIENPGGSDLVNYFIKNHPDHPRSNDAAHILGNYFFDKRNYREAIPAFQQVKLAVSKTDQIADVQFKTGYSYFQLKDNANALRYFNTVKGSQNQYKADAHYYAGYIAMEQGNYQQAISDFKEADKAAFYASKVPYMLAGVYYRQGYYDELISYAEPVLANRKNLEKREEIHLYLAEAYFEKRDFTRAAANYDAFVNARKGNLSRAQVYKAGIAQFEIQNYQRATDYFKVSAVENDEIGQVSSYYLGHSYIKLNNTQFASTSFNAASKIDANPQLKEDAIVNYAKVNLERGSFQEAVAALDSYLENYPNGRYAKEAESLLTDALINTNNYLRAIDHIEKMPRKSDRIREAYQKVTFYQAIVYYRDKQYDQSTRFFDKSISEPKDRNLVLDAYFWKGENFASKGDLPQAIRAYENVQSQRTSPNNPTLIKSYYGLGYALFNTEQYSRAETQFKNYVDRQTGSSPLEHYDEALIRLGDTYYVQKKFTDAQNTFQRAIRENSNYIDYAYFRSGVVFNFQNRNDQAIEQMNMLINNYPNSLYLEDALFQKSQINMEEMRYAEASDGFSRLISSRPNSPFVPFALEGRAVANFSQQNYNATIEDYKRILERHPNSSNAEAALVGLQEALAIQGRSAEFSQYLSGYRNANPDNRSLQNLEYESAKSLYFSNSWEQAINAFETYLKNYPQASNRAEANFFIGDSHYRAGRKSNALDYFYEIDKEKDSPQRMRAVQRIAAIELENKNYQKAIPYLRESSKNARNQIEEYEAFNGLMHAHYETSRMDSAIFYADKVISVGSVTGDAIPEALLLKGKAFQKSNKIDDSEETFRDLINEYKTVHGAEGLFLLAESIAKKGNYSQSNDIIFDFSGPYSGYDYWYGRAFILLAENYINLGEQFQAKATLESIVERATNEEIRKMAQEKLSTIK